MEGGAFILLVVAAFIVVSALIGVRDRRREKQTFMQRASDSYGKKSTVRYDNDAWERIPKYFKAHQNGFVLDDITWNDLELDDVFRRVNYCFSAAGEESLYATLRSPILADDFADLEARIHTFQSEEAFRTAMQYRFYRIGRTGKYSVYDYLQALDSLEAGSNAKDVLMIVLIAAAIVLLFIAFPLGLLLLVGFFAAQLISFYKIRAVFEPYLVCFDYILRLLKNGKELRKDLGGVFEKDAQTIDGAVRQMGAFESGAFLARAGLAGGNGVTGNVLDILLDYVNILFHLNLMKFRQMLSSVRQNRDAVETLIRTTGELEAALSIACYRASLKTDESEGYCLPEFTTEDVAAVSFTDVVHPLLDDAVPDSITTDKSVLITGSNASGKSTFLKSCALCAVMAQTIHTCTASAYRAPLTKVYTSMALRDALFEGESYYIVEIKSLKRILDAAKEDGIPVLCFIDEVLRGTNTVERIAASSQVLKTFGNTKAIVFAATHDLELTTLLPPLYDNYHFAGTVEDGDVRFDYLLHEGPGNARNAIALLSRMGYDAQTVREAERMASTFLTDGVWRM